MTEDDLLVSPARITPEEYLVKEQAVEQRREYLGGYVYPMPPVDVAHELVAGILAMSLFNLLRGSGYSVFKGGMKLRMHIAGQDVFYYPDVMVVGDPTDNHRFYKERPRLLSEVMMADARSDRLEKYLSYIRLPSLEEYVLIDPDPANKQVTIFRREDGWEPGEVVTSGEFTLRSVGLTLRVEDLYRP